MHKFRILMMVGGLAWASVGAADAASAKTKGQAAGKSAPSGQGGHNPTEVFQKHDKNGDGFLTQEELAVAKASHPGLLEKLDSNRDGKLSWQEFQNVMQVMGKGGQSASKGQPAGRSGQAAGSRQGSQGRKGQGSGQAAGMGRKGGQGMGLGAQAVNRRQAGT